MRPYLTEYCNNKDDDCDGLIDETRSEDLNDNHVVDAVLFYQDMDGDGFGSLFTDAIVYDCSNVIDEFGLSCLQTILTVMMKILKYIPMLTKYVTRMLI